MPVTASVFGRDQSLLEPDQHTDADTHHEIQKLEIDFFSALMDIIMTTTTTLLDC